MKPVIVEPDRLETPLTRALWALVNEIRRARDKHGAFTPDPAIRSASYTSCTSSPNTATQTGKGLREELLQVAAVCVRWAAELER